ncbi:MAG TPA: hypothetical protein VF808_06645 [Ktedonobacterales bacterium]
MEYRNGHLYFGLTSAVNCSGVVEDGLLWASIMPQLSTLATHNPQQVAGLARGYTDSGYWCLSGADSCLPAVAPTTEGDVALVYQYSSVSVYPSVAYTGRMAVDTPGTMGQGGVSSVVVAGHYDDLTVFFTNAVCALAPNLVSRGTLYCASAYGGANSSMIWDTELLSLRLE